MKTSHSANSAAAKQFGRYVRARRLSLGLSRAELARRLGLILGSHISHVERGEARIADDAVANWAQALEVEAHSFSQQCGIVAAENETLTVERSFSPVNAPQIAIAETI